MKKNTFVGGTIIASLAIIITKILGVLYVIPFHAIIGEDGGTLYSYAYNIYNLFLNIATAGIPVAISMIISEYQALGMYDAKKRAYSISKKIIAIISIVAFLVLFIFAEGFGNFFVGGITDSNSVSDIALVIRSISTCLLIIPFLSVLRGYIQGNKVITPTSISQVIEQLVRVLVIVFGSYISINCFKSTVPVAVSIALSGAFFGGVIAYIYLRYKVNKNKQLFESENVKKDNITNKEIIKKIISYCIPLILIAVLTNIYDIIDQKLIIKGLNMISYPGKEAEAIAGYITTWGPKICMIIVAISMGLTTSLIPHMVEVFTKNDKKELNNKFNEAIKMIIFITAPMAIGLFLLSDEIYNLFYATNKYGALILKYLSILNIFTAVLTIMNTALQGMKKFKLIYINSIISIIIKVLLDIPLIMLFNNIGIYPFYGTLTATIISCIISYLIVLIYLKKKEGFKYKPILDMLKKLIGPILAMVVVVFALEKSLTYLIKTPITIMNLLIAIICALVGATIFIYLTYRNNLIKDVLGIDLKEKIKSIFRKRKKNEH